MANWNFNFLTSLKVSLFSEIHARLKSLAKMDGSIGSPEIGMIRWSPSAKRWEQFASGTWVQMSHEYNINVTTLNGQAADFYRNASNLNTGTISPYRLPTGNSSTRGGVKLSASTTSTQGVSQGVAAAPVAVKEIGDRLAGLFNTTSDHAHNFIRTTGSGAQNILQTYGANADNLIQTLHSGSSNLIQTTNENSHNYIQTTGRNANIKFVASAGSITASSPIVSGFSDPRLKTDIERIQNPVAKTRMIRGYTAKPNAIAQLLGANDKTMVCLLTTEVEQALPQIVHGSPLDPTDADGNSVSGQGYKTITEEHSIPLLFETLNIALDKIDALEAKLEAVQ